MMLLPEIANIVFELVPQSTWSEWSDDERYLPLLMQHADKLRDYDIRKLCYDEWAIPLVMRCNTVMQT